MAADVRAIQALYRANGFDEATVTTDVKDADSAANGKPLKVAQIRVTYMIVGGAAAEVRQGGAGGVDASRTQDVKALMNTQAGQPFSLVTLSGDRDAVLEYYLSHGFDQVKVDIKQQKEAQDPDKTNVSLNVTEGQQVFVNRVLLSGVDKTKPKVVQSADPGACGRSAGPDGVAGDATEPVQHRVVQRGDCGGAESRREMLRRRMC